MTEQQNEQKQLIIQSLLDAFKELPPEGSSWFCEIQQDTSDYS